MKLALDFKQIIQVIQVGGAADEVAAVLLFPEQLHHFVVLVPDLAHQFLHDILHGDNTLGAAVLVNDDGHMGLVPLEHPQQFGNLGGTSGVLNGGLQMEDIAEAAVTGRIKILLMNQADDIIDIVVIDGQTGISAFHKQPCHLFHRGGVLGCHQVHAGCQDFRHLQIAELDGIADQIALVLVKTALILRLIDHAHQLLFGDAVVAVVAEHQRQELFPHGEQEVGRGQNPGEEPQQRRGKHGPGFGVFLGQALGGNLAEDQNDDGQHRSGHRGAAGLTDEPDKQHGADGGGHVVDNVVADEDGGEQLVVILRQRQRFGSPAVAVFGAVFQTDAVERCKGRFCSGKITGHGDQGQQGHDHH